MKKDALDVLASMLATGAFSDFTISCEGREFKVHKGVVCTHSPVLAASAKHNFKEAQTGVYEVTQFDAETTYQMLQFMYTGEYTNKGEPADDDGHDAREARRYGNVNPMMLNITGNNIMGNNIHQSDKIRAFCAAATERSRRHFNHPSTTPSDGPIREAELQVHIRANAIGDYLGVDKLVSLANANVKLCIYMWEVQKLTLADRLPDICKFAIDSAGDKEIVEILASAMAANIDEVISSGALEGHALMSGFASRVLYHCNENRKQQLGKKHPA